MMELVDEDGSGEVTFDEFVNKVAYDEEVMKRVGVADLDVGVGVVL